jgi:prolyl-tRNA editing enzyme YbaK/EbsC (Cys-tRNA(Pro) deacylase)
MDLPKSARRFHDAAIKSGLDIRITEMPDSTRTAEEAASACGCGVGQIVKSLVFSGRVSSSPYLLLVSGENRVNVSAMAKIIGEPLDRPDATYVRTHTSYSIGGIPPLGFDAPIKTWIDEDLLQYDEVYAAAGTPRCIFGVDPQKLARAASAQTTTVT